MRGINREATVVRGIPQKLTADTVSNIVRVGGITRSGRCYGPESVDKAVRNKGGAPKEVEEPDDKEKEEE